MYQSFHIRGYRGFPRLEVEGLGRVNLFVGKNNSGKTSVLEALNLLVSRGNPITLWQVAARRGEHPERIRGSREEIEVDISHLFSGHRLKPEASFQVAARDGRIQRTLEYIIKETTDDESNESKIDERNPQLDLSVFRLSLALKGEPKPLTDRIPLTRRGTMSSEVIELSRPRRRISNANAAVFISTESLSPDELANVWDDISLTDAEERVLNALRVIEPGIERIAPIVGRPYYSPFSQQRGGFKVKLKNQHQPIPIGSLGDGIWRLLSMATSLVRAKDGVLLIDEIDTGLHYSVMADLWRLIFVAAQDFNIQIFATTHSYDCVHSLSAICDESVDANSKVSIQRIEKGKEKSIPYTEAEIKEAARRNLEVR